MMPVPDWTINNRPWESKMMPRGVERLVAMMSHSKPVAATGEVDALTEDVQFWAVTERKKRRRRERRIIFTGGMVGMDKLVLSDLSAACCRSGHL